MVGLSPAAKLAVRPGSVIVGEDSKPELIISAGRHTRWTRLNMRAEHRLDTAAEIASTGRAEAGGGS